jgi:hypothetical protein
MSPEKKALDEQASAKAEELYPVDAEDVAAPMVQLAWMSRVPPGVRTGGGSFAFRAGRAGRRFMDLRRRISTADTASTDIAAKAGGDPLWGCLPTRRIPT